MKYKKTLLVLFFVSTPIWAFPGDIVFDPSVEAAVSSMSTMTNVNLAAQITHLIEQCNYLKQELTVLQGGAYQWSDAQEKINELGNLVNNTNTIAYNAGDLDSKFRQNFPGYKPPTDYASDYKNMVNHTLDTLNVILRASGTSAADFQNESSRIKFLQNQVQNSQGQTQAIQAASQIASEQATQLQLLRQAVVAQTNAQTAYYASEVQKDASRESSLNAVIGNGKTTAPAIGNSGQSVDVPDF